MKIGIIGVGMVGGAIQKVVKKHFILFKVFAYDKNGKFGTFESVLPSDLIFVCVPTPTKNDWTQDLSAINEVFQKLSDANYQGEVVLKSTVLPGVCDQLAKAYPKLQIIHNPEFLRANHAEYDFKEQPVAHLSCPTPFIKTWKFYKEILGGKPIIAYTDYKVTEALKYQHNCFLATKIIFFNEFANYCKKIGVNPDQVTKGAALAGGIGPGHFNVPGPDKKFGFGGMCFPKDTKAFLKQVNTLGLRFHTLGAAVEVNKELRPEEM